MKARNCAFINQLATPGLGSLMGGRLWAGAGQLALALTGFVLVVCWFAKTVIGYYGLMFDQQSEPQSYATWGWAGMTTFAVAWFWALVSSFSLYRQAKTAQKMESENKPVEPPGLKMS